ncbi:response regulator [Halarcobacter ebronensis]|uniref:Response regulatory domain-containing protein n=1 Tax=Halarcobacter ebronensis TaxID=1462615 RepID=A0A4Q1AR23_9BACT|nr:response regulator [Halarcobacter ebronensis]QKF83436.1 PAS sensor-containing response regulator [Halarcobacter ebronensis]RXK08237.1 hypothetical protein CRV07_00050 [Halarcobacter ebronensis]
MKENFLKELTIICAEDSNTIRSFMQEHMGKAFKNFYALKDGQKALEFYKILRLKNIKIDAIISDIHMPNMDGIELLKEIRKLDEKIPFIFTTAYLEKEYLLEAIKLQATEYIIKPIDIDSAIKKIEKECRFIKQQETIEKQKKELERYLEVIDTVANISKTDLHGNITYVNENFCNVSKYKKEELIGKPHSIVRHPDTPIEVFKEMWHTISLGKVWKGKIKNRAKDDSSYFVNTTIIPQYDEDGENIVEYIAIRFVITDEENERREFKKRVMHNMSESRKEKKKHEEYIKELESKIENQNREKGNKILENKLSSEKRKIEKLNSQILFYEEEMKILNEKTENIIAISNEKLKETYSYAKDLKNTNLQLNFDIKKVSMELKDKNRELIKIQNRVVEQNKIIENLRDVIEHREAQLSEKKKS